MFASNTGERRPPSKAVAYRGMFQSAPPRRGRPARSPQRQSPPACFNPRPREGGDRRVARCGPYHAKVSIRAPAKGATLDPGHLRQVDGGFQSAPPRRGRHRFATCHTSHRCFNPRPREGGDGVAGPVCAVRWCFNPRPREGGDANPVACPTPSSMFQSAPPRRGRRGARSARLRCSRVSIRAPAKGATFGHLDVHLHLGVSIRAPAKGATGRSATRRHRWRSFNPRPREGGDQASPRHGTGMIMFQSAPPRRGRPAA